MANQVYDPETDDQSASGPPDLGSGHNRPAGDPSDPRSGSSRAGLRQAERDGSGGLYNSSGDALDPEGLSESEDAAASGYGSGFDATPERSRRERVIGFARRNRSKLMIGSGVGGTSLISILIALFSLIPLKIEHMVQNIQDRFMSPVTSALEASNEILLKKYIVKHVIPNYKSCGTTVDRRCKVRIVGGESNPATNMYRAWAKVRLENTLADKKIELKFDKHSGGGQWRMIAPGSAPGGDPIGRNGQGIDSLFNRKDRRAMVREIRNTMNLETKWERMTYRYKIGRYMSRIDGVKRYIFFDGTRNSIHGSIDEKKQAAKLILAERVLKPRSEVTYIAVKCVLDPDCHPENTQTNGRDPPTSPDAEDEMHEKLVAMAAEFGITDADKLARLKAIHSELSERGFQRHLLDSVFKLVFKETTSKSLTDAVPVVGWINLAAELVNAAHEIGPKVQKLAYLSNATAAVAMFMAYQSYSDEIHTGKVDAAVVGSMVDSLGPGIEDPNDPLVGGTAGAEESPLYDQVINGGADTKVATTSLLSAFLPGNAYAASSSAKPVSPNYLCNNGKPPTAGDICNEERLGQENDVQSTVNDFLNLACATNPASAGTAGSLALVGSSCADGIVTLAQIWRQSVGQAFKLVDNIIGGVASPILSAAEKAANLACTNVHVPGTGIDLHPGSLFTGLMVGEGFCAARDKVKEVAPRIVNGVTNWLIPNPWGTNMGGGRTLTMMMAGGNVYGEAACAQAGCGKVDGATVISILNQQHAEERERFNRQSVFARMFDTSSSYSLVSKVAMATPLDMRSSAQTGFASLITNPLSSLATSFGPILSSRSASAAASINPDPFNIGNSAFPTGKIPKDFEKAWDDRNCGDESDNGPIARWQQKAADDSVSSKTGMPVHNDVEPCLLIKEATGVGGGAFDSSLLTEDDLGEVPGETSGATISGNDQELAKKLVDSGKLTDEDGRYMAQIKAYAKGNYSCHVNSAILKTLVGVVVQDSHSVKMSSLNRKCTGVLTASGTASFHYAEGGGHAIDVVEFDGKPVTGSGTATINFLESASKYLPKNTGYGQVLSCSSGFDIPDGSYAVPDTCNHQHIQVPKD
ncbi:MAG: hypothetical protein AAB971_01220 [Patescibacteria group bacterium]